MKKRFLIPNNYYLKFFPKNLNKVFCYGKKISIHHSCLAFKNSSGIVKSYSKLDELKFISVGLASAETIRQWAEKTLPNGKVLGQVTTANTLHHKTFKPLKGGLFCERIFGPLKDFECACGKTQKPSEADYQKIIEHQQTERKFCPNCDVEYTWSVIRRYQLGYIQLASPVSHIWYLKANPSYLSILLDIKRKNLESILYCSETMTLENSWKAAQSYTLTNSPSTLFLAWQELLKEEQNDLANKTYDIQSNNSKNYALEPHSKDSSSRNYLSKQVPETHTFRSTIDSKSFLQKNLKKFLDTDKTSQLSSLDYFLNFPILVEKLRKELNRNGNNNVFEIKCFSVKPKRVLGWRKNSVSKKLMETNSFKTKIDSKQAQQKWSGALNFTTVKFLSTKVSFYIFSKLNDLIERKAISIASKKAWKIFYKSAYKQSLKRSHKLLHSKVFLEKNLELHSKYYVIKTSSRDSIVSEFLEANRFQRLDRLRISFITKENTVDILQEQALEKNMLKIFKFFFQQYILKCVKQLKKNEFSYQLDSRINNYGKFIYMLSKQIIQQIIPDPKALNNIYKFSRVTTNSFLWKKNLLASEQNLLGSFYQVLCDELTILIVKHHFNIFPETSRLENYHFQNNSVPETRSSQNSQNFTNVKFKAPLVPETHRLRTKVRLENYRFLNNSVYTSSELALLINNNLKTRTNVSKKIFNKVLNQLQKNSLNTHSKQKMGNRNLNFLLHYSGSKIQKKKLLFKPKIFLKSTILEEKNVNFLETASFSTKVLKNQSFSEMSPFKINILGTNISKQRRSNIFVLNKNLKLRSSFSTILKNKRFLWQKKIKNTNTKKFFKMNKLYNNIYVLSHRFCWSMDKNWQYFIFYNSSTADFEDFPLPAYRHRTLNSNELSLDQNLAGAGIIQRLLSELHSKELVKMDKQNRILLYELNKKLTKYKNLVKRGFADRYEKKQLKELYDKRDLLIRRTKITRKLSRKSSHPQSMILTVLPVLPPDLRPILKMGNQIAASDLNRLYQRVIYRNERLKKFLKDPATSNSFEMKYAQRLLQEAVDNLINNGKGGVTSEKDSRGRALKSLSEVLKGKQGRFRQYLLGKRVDYSGRSVIVVGPKLKIHECGLPKEMALELFLPFIIKRILHYKLARTVIGAKIIIKSNKKVTWEILREVMQNSPILLNRAPTLHRLGIQAFQPKLVEGRAILLHPLVCPAFNADFDGDQMAVHVPITVEARAEAWKLIFSRNNLISPATGEPIVLPSQDMVLGCYYLTTENFKQLKFDELNFFFKPILETSVSKQARSDIRTNNFQKLKFQNLSIPETRSSQNSLEISDQKILTLYNKLQKKQQLITGLYFSNINQVLMAYQQGKVHVNTSIWLKWNGFVEMGNEKNKPLEIRVNSDGYWYEILPKYQTRFNHKGKNLGQLIRTTPGRIVMNLMIYKCMNSF